MTAKEIVLALPSRLKAEEAAGQTGVFHFQLEGETGGEFTVNVAIIQELRRNRFF